MSVPITSAQTVALYALRKALRGDSYVSAMSPDGLLVTSGDRAWVVTPEGRTLRVEGEVRA